MSKRVLTIIIILSGISLVAAIITQLFWVRDAWQVKEDQFTDRVNIALKSVVNQLMASHDYDYSPVSEEVIFAVSLPENLLEIVPPSLLDSLLRLEFGSLRIKEDYVYGVVDNARNELLYGIYGSFKQEVASSPFTVSLDCLCQTNDFDLKVFFPNQQQRILADLIVLPVMSGLFLLVLIFSFFFTIYFIIRQKKLNEMKTDFINNMTHEFKTPISTISVSCEMLMKSGINDSPEKVVKYAGIIFEENTRLKHQVEKVLQTAILDKQDFTLKMKEVNVNEVLHDCIRNFRMQAEERKGTIHEEYLAGEPVITADKLHFTNIINNLIDNACKYSIDSPDIRVTTRNSNGGLIISVEDKGIGISRENLKVIFKKFHRIQAGNIHDVKGFGLGLYYVKTITEIMGGKIEVQSQLKRGSRFEITFLQKQ